MLEPTFAPSFDFHQPNPKLPAPLSGSIYFLRDPVPVSLSRYICAFMITCLVLCRERNVASVFLSTASLKPFVSAPTNNLDMSRDSVSACVASLSSAYHDGVELIQHIKGKRKSRYTFQDASIDASTQELESSLNRGESAVSNQYERTYKSCGDAFAQGDRMFSSHKYSELLLNILQSLPGMLCRTLLLTSKDK